MLLISLLDYRNFSFSFLVLGSLGGLCCCFGTARRRHFRSGGRSARARASFDYFERRGLTPARGTRSLLSVRLRSYHSSLTKASTRVILVVSPPRRALPRTDHKKRQVEIYECCSSPTTSYSARDGSQRGAKDFTVFTALCCFQQEQGNFS